LRKGGPAPCPFFWNGKESLFFKIGDLPLGPPPPLSVLFVFLPLQLNLEVCLAHFIAPRSSLDWRSFSSSQNSALVMTPNPPSFLSVTVRRQFSHPPRDDRVPRFLSHSRFLFQGHQLYCIFRPARFRASPTSRELGLFLSSSLLLRDRSSSVHLRQLATLF